MFQLLLRSACTASRPSLFLTMSITREETGDGQDAGKGHTWAADPSWSKGCPMPYKSLLSNKVLGGSFSRVVIAQRLAGHQPAICLWEVVRDCLCNTCSFWFFPSLFPPHFLNSLHLDTWGPSHIYSFNLLPPHNEAGSEQAASGCVIAGQGQTTTK